MEMFMPIDYMEPKGEEKSAFPTQPSATLSPVAPVSSPGYFIPPKNQRPQKDIWSDRSQKNKGETYAFYVIRDDDSTLLTTIQRHTVKTSDTTEEDFYYLSLTPPPRAPGNFLAWAFSIVLGWIAKPPSFGFNYLAKDIDQQLAAKKMRWRQNACLFGFVEGLTKDNPGRIVIATTEFSEDTKAEIQNSQKSKMEDRAAEDTFFAIPKRWRPQMLGDDLFKILIFGIVVMLITWVVLTNLPGVLNTISANVDAHVLNATNSVVANISSNHTVVTGT